METRQEYHFPTQLIFKIDWKKITAMSNTFNLSLKNKTFKCFDRCQNANSPRETETSQLHRTFLWHLGMNKVVTELDGMSIYIVHLLN